MSKYINADELMEIIKTHHYMLANAINSRDYGMFTTGIEQAISETESVEVVRCKDCRYSKSVPKLYGLEFWCMFCGTYRTATDFCSQAERRESDG